MSATNLKMQFLFLLLRNSGNGQLFLLAVANSEMRARKTESLCVRDWFSARKQKVRASEIGFAV